MLRLLTASRWFTALPVLAGLLLVLPTLGLGLIGDDYVHWAILTGRADNAQPGTPLGLFTFVDGDTGRNQALIESGRLMWWSAADLRLSFWRPLSELTHWLDYRLWPDAPALMHAHSLAWYALLLVLLTKTYRAIGPALQDGDARAPVLAALLFALNPMHLFTVGWLASRNQLVSASFSLLALLAFHRWRRTGGVGPALAAGAALLLALLGAEAGIATLGWMLAYVLVFEQGRAPWRARLLALLPFIVVVLIWKAVHNHYGFGSQGSGAYVDPGSAPLQFAQALLTRLPALMLAQLYGAPSAVLKHLAPATQAAYAAAAVLAIGVAAAVAWRLKVFATPAARFWALGALLVLVPACASEPTDRQTLNADVGMSMLLALLILRLASAWRELPGWRHALVKGGGLLLGGIHLVVFPLLLAASALLLKGMTEPSAVDEPLSIPAEGLGPDTRAVLLNPPVVMYVYYYPVVREYFGATNPASIQALAPGDQQMQLDVLDDRTLQLTVDKGFAAAMCRDTRARPFRPGDRVAMGSMEARVLAVTPEGAPRSVVFSFDAPLSSGKWRFYAWQDGGGYAPFALPAPGQRVALQPAKLDKMIAERLRTAWRPRTAGAPRRAAVGDLVSPPPAPAARS